MLSNASSTAPTTRRTTLPRRLTAAAVALVAGLGGGAATASADVAESTTGRAFELRNVGSGLVADAPDWSTTAGTEIVQWTSNCGANQRWILDVAKSGTRTLYTIRNQFSGLCLAPKVTTTTVTVQQLGCAPGVAQYWHFAFDGARYTVRNEQTGTRLSVTSSTAGSRLKLGTPAGVKTLGVTSAEQWRLTSYAAKWRTAPARMS